MLRLCCCCLNLIRKFSNSLNNIGKLHCNLVIPQNTYVGLVGCNIGLKKKKDRMRNKKSCLVRVEGW